MRHLVIGLGNPGKEYDGTRHNVGFAVAAHLVKVWSAVPVKTKTNAVLWESRAEGVRALIAAPRTFMNASGEAVAPLLRAKRIPPGRLILVHDELDLPFGEVRVSRNASAAGHNGVRSVIDALGTQEFARVRVGIGRDPRIPADRYVLAHFTEEERKQLPEIIARAATEVECLIGEGR